MKRTIMGNENLLIEIMGISGYSYLNFKKLTG